MSIVGRFIIDGVKNGSDLLPDGRIY